MRRSRSRRVGLGYGPGVPGKRRVWLRWLCLAAEAYSVRLCVPKLPRRRGSYLSQAPRPYVIALVLHYESVCGSDGRPGRPVESAPSGRLVRTGEGSRSPACVMFHWAPLGCHRDGSTDPNRWSPRHLMVPVGRSAVSNGVAPEIIEE